MVSGRTVANPEFKVRSGTMPSGKERLYLYPTITDIPNSFPAECTLKYTIQYGLLNEDYTHKSLTIQLNMTDARFHYVLLVDSSEHARLGTHDNAP